MALCTEYLWTYRFSDLLFNLYYLMIILIINVITEFVDVKHISYTFKLFWSIPPLLLTVLNSHLPLRSSAHPEQGN